MNQKYKSVRALEGESVRALKYKSVRLVEPLSVGDLKEWRFSFVNEGGSVHKKAPTHTGERPGIVEYVLGEHFWR